jgi:phytanoyl-CoA hydroxylase
MALDLAAVVAGYHDRGYAIVEDLVPAAWCDNVIAAAQGLPCVAGGAPRVEMNVHLLAPIFEQTMAHSGILQVVDRLVGGLASGLQSQFFFGPPGTPGFHAHQDNHYVQSDPACFASAWLALVDISPANGGLFVHPRSHRDGGFPVRTIDGSELDTRFGVREATEVPRQYEAIEDVTVRRGSVVFLHGHVVHGSYPNRTESRRYVLLNTYLRTGSAFRPGHTAKRQEHTLPRAPLYTAA